MSTPVRPPRTLRKFNSDDSLRDAAAPMPQPAAPNRRDDFAASHRLSQHGFTEPPREYARRYVTSDDNDDDEDDSSDYKRKVRAADERPSPLDYIKQVFKSSKSRGVRFWAAVICGVLVLLIVALALALYFYFWVGNPQVSVLRVIPPSGDFKNNAVIDLGDKSAGVGPSMIVNVTLEVQITNPNRLQLALNQVDIRAYHPLVPTLQIASSFLDSLVLPAEGVVVQQIPLSLRYKFSDDPTSSIPKDLVAACTIPAGKTAPEKQLQILVAVDTLLRITSLIRPAVPTIRSDPSFDCPFTGSSAFTIAGAPVDLARIDWQALQGGTLGYLPATTTA